MSCTVSESQLQVVHDQTLQAARRNGAQTSCTATANHGRDRRDNVFADRGLLDVDPCRLSSNLTNWTLSSRLASGALKKWSVPDHQYAAQMCQSPERCSSTFHSARRHLMILTQSSRPRFVSSTGNVAVPQHQPSQARTSSTVLRRGRQKLEQWRSQRNVPARNWKMCSSTAPLRASQQGGLHKRQSVSFQESPSRETPCRSKVFQPASVEPRSSP